MIDDLVKRLRSGHTGQQTWLGLCEDAADRIEELEAENAKLKIKLCERACQNTYDMNDIVDLGMVRDQQADRIEELEAKLVKAMDALEEIAKPRSQFNKHAGMSGSFEGDLRVFARATLAELKGGDA